jgi:hypothetical protein
MAHSTPPPPVMHERNGALGIMANGKWKPEQSGGGGAFRPPHVPHEPTWEWTQATATASAAAQERFSSQRVSWVSDLTASCICVYEVQSLFCQVLWPLSLNQLHTSNNQHELHCIYQSVCLSSSVQRQVRRQLPAARNKKIEQAFRTRVMSCRHQIT